MRRLLLCIAFLSCYSNAQAQIARDTLKDAEVHAATVVPDAKDAYATGIKRSEISKRPSNAYQSLAELLAAGSTAFIKSTGLNTFSTLSLRGASAAQSAVYWEGVPLMNGATGLSDLSTIPVGLFSSVTLDYGSSAALWGSGNVGGAVMLQDFAPTFNTTPLSRERFDIATGSFGLLNGGARISHSARRLFVSGALAGGLAENNFAAKDEQGNSFITENARQFSYNTAATVGYSLGSAGELIARAQYYYYDRLIPRALFEARSVKAQEDGGYRTLLHWKRAIAGKASYAKLAMLGNTFSYSDSSIGLTSKYATRQLFAEAGFERTVFNNDRLLFFAPLQYLWLEDAPTASRQFRGAVASAYTHKGKRFQPSAVLRLESFDGKLIALPGGNALYILSTEMRFRANVQYTYRAPTLNELYYNPGGNAGLKPEHGWNSDGGIQWTKSKGPRSYDVDLSVFERRIQDWIIWLGGAIWTPHNLASVHSRGIEIENSVRFGSEHYQARIGLNAGYTRSTVTESYLPGDNSIGRQIPYVPLFMFNGVATLRWKAFVLEWTTSYAGQRFTVSDESQRLPGYSVSNVQVSYDWMQKCFLRFSVNNLFNEQYTVVASRPMPGINWSLSVSVHLQKSRE